VEDRRTDADQCGGEDQHRVAVGARQQHQADECCTHADGERVGLRPTVGEHADCRCSTDEISCEVRVRQYDKCRQNRLTVAPQDRFKFRTVHASADHAALRQVQFAEMTIAVGQIHGHGFAGFRPSPSHFRETKFKTVRTVDAYTMFGLGHGIEDRLTTRFDIARDIQKGSAPVHIDLELDIGIDRVMDLFQGRGEDVENRRSRLGVLSAQYAQKSIALRIVGALVDDERRFAAPS